jgi:hypothetical protein
MKYPSILISILAFAALCGCDNNKSVGKTPVPILDSIAVTAEPTSLLTGETVVFVATGTMHSPATPDQFFERDVTAAVLWESSSPDLLLIGPDGRGVAKGPGTVTIRALTPDGTADGAGISSESIDITISSS